MLAVLIILLAVLWFLGYIHIEAIPIPDVLLLTINGRNITLWDALIFLVILIVIGILPGPFRYIAAALLLIWTLAVLGIIALTSLPSMIVIAIIVGLIAYMVSVPRS